MAEPKLTDEEIRRLRALLAKNPDNLTPVPPAPVGSPRSILDKIKKEKDNGS